MSRSSRRLARAVLLAGVAGALVLLPGRPAAAHAVLVDSVPANGATVPVSPASLVLRFSEDIAPRFSSVRLVDGGGRAVAGTRLRVERDTRQVTVDLPRLGAGSYGAAWQVLAQRDGHVTAGVLVFSVDRAGGAPALARAPSGTGASPGAVLLRCLGLSVLA